jgi:hypothetical protein
MLLTISAVFFCSRSEAVEGVLPRDTAPSLPRSVGPAHYDGNYLTAVERSASCSAPRRRPGPKLRDRAVPFAGLLRMQALARLQRHFSETNRNQ